MQCFNYSSGHNRVRQWLWLTDGCGVASPGRYEVRYDVKAFTSKPLRNGAAVQRDWDAFAKRSREVPVTGSYFVAATMACCLLASRFQGKRWVDLEPLKHITAGPKHELEANFLLLV